MEGVEADIQPVQPGLTQVFGHCAEQLSVGGHRQIFNAFDGRQA
jgi:hypothetical protein